MLIESYNNIEVRDRDNLNTKLSRDNKCKKILNKNRSSNRNMGFWDRKVEKYNKNSKYKNKKIKIC